MTSNSLLYIFRAREAYIKHYFNFLDKTAEFKRKPAVSVKIAQQYFDDNFNDEVNSFNLIGGFYEKTY